jgi:hypothetical protein
MPPPIPDIQRVLIAASLLLGAWVPGVRAAQTNQTATVEVILWFDTEDYLLPASDDAAKRLAELLTARNVRATFKVVGEKARTLERRGRRDVIDALRRHAIAYHTDFHSVHPTPTEYLAECGFLDGVAEFVVRERAGAADVRRIFGVDTLACYGQPGSSWAPQAVAALARIGVAPSGIPCYVDEGDHVGLDEKPFWYCGALNVYHMGANCTRMDLHDPAAVEPAKQHVSALAERLAREQDGGLISIYYHPCEWVHQQFWDGVNFSRGRNPPREQWKAPPQRPAAETDAAFARFARYIDHIRSIAGVRFVTASDLPALYPDLVRTEGVTQAELGEVAQRILAGGAKGLDFQIVGNQAFSVADQFELLTLAVGGLIDGHPPGFPLIAKGCFGPDSAPPASPGAPPPSWPAFRDATLAVREFVRNEQRIPARVFIGVDAAPPLEFLVALAGAYDSYRQHGSFPPTEGVRWGTAGELLPARHIALDTPDLFGGWVIHREGFRAPKLLEVARLQAWTLKPALRQD